MEQILNIKEAVEIYERGLSNLFRNPNEWKDFLKFSSKFYKYKFHENLLLYSQDKNITACATFDEWKKIGRYVKPYSKSLKTLYTENGRLYLKSVFDLKDTNSKTDIEFKLWNTSEKEASDILKNNLNLYFDENESNLTYIVNTYLSTLLGDEEFLKKLELPFEQVYTDEFYNTFLESVTTVVLNRCGVEYEPNLIGFDNLQNEEILKRIGYVVNKCSYDLLKIIELEIKQKIKRKEWEEIYDERNRITENEQDIGGTKTNQIPRTNNEWDDKRSIGEQLTGDSKSRTNNRKTIKRAISKTRYSRIRSNSTIREYDTNIKNGDDKQLDSRESRKYVDYDNGVVQTTLFNLSENVEISSKNNDDKEINEVTEINPFIEEEISTNIIPPSLFKIPDNLKDSSIGAKTKYQENIEAIKLLKELENNNRTATDEEKIILAKYNGWGGLSKSFEENSEQYYELQELLSPEEFRSARESALTSFYTEPYIIDFMYKAIQRFGINNKCRILDPSAGVGNFIGRVPEELKNSKITAIEKDSLTGRLLKKIYDTADVQIKGYEETKLNNNYFDVAISNIPFGDFGVFDKNYDSSLKIHDYYFEKTIDKVKPGGIVAFITSRYTLDKKDSKIREYLEQKANFIGAVRLPNTAFKQIANTEAISDIIFLQKKGRELEQKENWIDTFEMQDGININNYFTERRYMVKGDIKISTNQFGETLDIVPNGDLKEQLEETLKMLPSNIIDNEELSQNYTEEQGQAIPVDEKYSHIKDYSYAEINGNIYYRINDYLYEQNKSQTALQRIKGLIKVRTALRDLINIQNSNVSDEETLPYQARLNQIYDEFVKKFGYITDRANDLAFRNDADFPLLISLEKEDKETKKITKTDIFTKRTIKPYKEIVSTDNAKEALIASINQKGKVDLKYIMNLCNKDYDTVITELKGLIYHNPEISKQSINEDFDGWETADQYLSRKCSRKIKNSRTSC